MTSANGTYGDRPTAAVCAPDEARAERLSAALEAEGIGVSAVVHGEDGLLDLSPTPDVIVLVAKGATKRAAVIRRLRSALAGVQVIVVGVSAKGHEIRSALEAGAGGFVFEEEIESTLGLTARVACAGQVAVPRRERRQVEKPTLSYREKQILGLVVMGYMNCEIAERLYLAESTRAPDRAPQGRAEPLREARGGT